MNKKPHILGSKNNWGMQSKKMVFKTCEGIPCSSFSVKELYVIVHHKISFLTLLNFWPFCTEANIKPPYHSRTWWLRWELGIVTRSYCHIPYYVYCHNHHIGTMLLFYFKNLTGQKTFVAKYGPMKCQTASDLGGHQHAFPNYSHPWHDHCWHFFNSMQIFNWSKHVSHTVTKWWLKPQSICA